MDNIKLGMNRSTASHRLVKDLLWNYIIKCGDNKCYQCGKEMSREDFSVEHKTPWLHSEDEKKLFFDLNNIAFSHLSCNTKAGRKPPKGRIPMEEVYRRKNEYRRNTYSKEERRERYIRTGK